MKRILKVLAVALASTLLVSCSSSSQSISNDEIKEVVERYAHDYGYINEEDIEEHLGEYFKKYAFDYDYYSIDEVRDNRRDFDLYDYDEVFDEIVVDLKSDHEYQAIDAFRREYGDKKVFGDYVVDKKGIPFKFIFL